MNELAAALRQLADRIEEGTALPGACQAVVVLADDASSAQATYMGRYTPAAQAGIQVLAMGISKFNTSQLQSEQVRGAIFGRASGSTH